MVDEQYRVEFLVRQYGAEVVGHVLGQVVAAARRALQRMEPDQVPPPLRRVARHAGRRLPPPLLVTLLTEVESSAWLQEKTAEEITADGPARIFLERPPGWRTTVAAAVADEASRRLRDRFERLEKENQRLQDQVRELRRELSDARDALGRKGSEETRELEEGNRRLRARLAEADSRIRSLEDTVASVRAELAAAREETDELRRAARRSPRPSASPPPERDPVVFGRGSPIETARTLDVLAESLGVAGPEPVDPPPGGPAPRPQGLRPDRSEMVDWLLSGGVVGVLLIDGYNLAHQLGEGERADVLAVARRLLAAGRGRLRVVVVFDTSDDASSETVQPGLTVRFEPSADEALVLLAGPDTAVATSDRAVREATEAKGAIGVWSEAVAEWARGG
ncbi:MAG: hypothetical protein KatS3mg011_1788 [Acidimicrobiia bacterium]|nr:MAG: hypothetical protein KatS3mg011_1788 [Acidimicrobiia bacterium]